MARRLTSPVFVARDQQIANLLEAAEAAEAGRPSVILVGGEAGVGKSRLVAEIGDLLRARGWTVLSGGAVALGEDGLPFGPIIEALRGLAREVDSSRIASAAGPMLPDLTRLVPEMGLVEQPEVALGGGPEWLQTRAFQAVRTLLAGLAGDGPVMLTVEDVHWADRSTRDLLAYVARTALSERVLVVATFRTDELHRRHPLLPWLAEVERLAGVVRVDLLRLEVHELADLLAGILGERPSAGLLRSIAERSEGNPFFAEELLAAADDGSTALPTTLREVLLVRLGAVSDAAGRLAEVAAVAGPEVEHEVLAEVSGLSGADLANPLRELLAAQLLLVAPQPDVERYRFRHALVPEALYGQLLPAERRRTHAAFARALERQGDGDAATATSRLVEVAHHWLLAREPAPALRAAVAAADAVAGRHAYAEAAGLYDKAIELWDVVDPAARPADRDLGDLLEAAGAAASLAGDPEHALRRCRAAIAFADEPTGPVERRARVRLRLAVVAQQAGDTETSVMTLEDAVGLLESGPPSGLRARALERLAANLMLAGRSSESLPLAQRAIDEARAAAAESETRRIDWDYAAPELIEANARATLGVARVHTGDIEGGLDDARRACRLAAEVGDPWVTLRAHANLGSVLEVAGQLEGALEANDRGLEILRSVGAGRTMFAAGLEVNAATLLIQLGRFGEADALLHPLADAPLPSFAMVNVHGAIADLAMRRGDLDRARTHLATARAKFVNLDDAQYTISHATIGVEIALWSGERDEALEQAVGGMARIGDKDDALLLGPFVSVAVAAAADVAITARARRDSTRLAEALRAADSFLERFRRSIARLALAGPIAQGQIAWRLELCEAELARGRGEDDAAQWAAVRAGLNAAERPFLAAYLRWREAEARAAGEGPAAAAAALREAATTAARIGARRLAAEVDRTARRLRIAIPEATESEAAAAGHGAPGGDAAAEPSEPYGLTRREREVLALVAAGYTNRRIADELFISESTAGVHVSNILGKLGVASRTEAATIAVRLGLDSAPAGPATPS